MIKSYLESANFYYYILHPPTFLEEYNIWWVDRLAGRPLGLAFTCLVLRVCSCSLQYLDESTERNLEMEMGVLVEDLSRRYHAAAQDFAKPIPPGRGGLYEVQQLLLSTSWYKSEVKYVDTWHELGVAIRAAQELGTLETFRCDSMTIALAVPNCCEGLHKVRMKEGLSEFEVKMRRRVWCNLYVWDWYVFLSFPSSLNIPSH